METSFPRVLPHERRTTILWANLPVTAVWLIGLLLGINLISVGTAIAPRMACAEDLISVSKENTRTTLSQD